MIGVPPKRGRQNSNFLTNDARLMKFSAQANTKKRKSLTKIRGHQNEGPSYGATKFLNFWNVRPYCRLFLSRLETDGFVFFFSSRLVCAAHMSTAWLVSSKFTRFTNMSNQISQIRVIAKKPLQQKQTFFFNALLFFSARLFLIH